MEIAIEIAYLAENEVQKLNIIYGSLFKQIGTFIL